MAYGRARAARRVNAGRFVPHPGWRHRVPEGFVLLSDQAAALTRVAELVDAELWRADKRTAWTAMLEGLVHGMDWTSGLVAGVTRAHLAERGGVGLRTVTSMLSWAQDVGLLVVVETGATAAFLGTEHNRAPSYVLTVPVGWAPRGQVSAGHSGPVDTSCDPPASCVSQRSPRRDRGLKIERRLDHDRAGGGSGGSWPLRGLARTAAERGCAVDAFLARAGVAGRVVRWRAVAMLGPWFAAGWSVKGLLHAVDFLPDGGVSRGDAARGARDPLRVFGARLGPWRGRLDAVPEALRAVPAGAAVRRPERTWVPRGCGSSVEGRAAARAEFAASVAARRAVVSQ